MYIHVATDTMVLDTESGVQQHMHVKHCLTVYRLHVTLSPGSVFQALVVARAPSATQVMLAQL